MKHFLLTIILCLLGMNGFSQNLPKEITPNVLKKIKEKIEFQIPPLRKKLIKNKLTLEEIEFSLDTFRIEKIAIKRIEIDYSTKGINNSTKELTNSYEKLMNKYYLRLMKLLKIEDKKHLIKAQKSWINFRNTEARLLGVLTKEEYSGGGSIQSNIRVGSYSLLLVSRTNTLFNYYNEIIKEKL